VANIANKEVGMNKEVYILGDVHGEYDKMEALLKKAGLIEYNMDEDLYHWKSGCKNTLIQVGDMIDGCNNSIMSYNFLKRIQEEATTEGGEVIRLLGNHELAYISPIKCTGMDSNTDLALRDIIKQDILDKKIIACYVLDDYLISHAGFAPSVIEEYGLYTETMVNNSLICSINNQDFRDVLFNIGESRGGLSDVAGIFWADWRRDQLAPIKQIVGHTSMGKITFEGDHINVDCGISRRSYNVYEILKYKNKAFEVISIDDIKEQP
jgi:hypothetical protein